jgi:hypothetical protein
MRRKGPFSSALEFANGPTAKAKAWKVESIEAAGEETNLDLVCCHFEIPVRHNPFSFFLVSEYLFVKENYIFFSIIFVYIVHCQILFDEKCICSLKK